MQQYTKKYQILYRYYVFTAKAQRRKGKVKIIIFLCCVEVVKKRTKAYQNADQEIFLHRGTVNQGIVRFRCVYHLFNSVRFFLL